MDKNIKKLLHEEIESEMKELSMTKLGGDEYKVTVNGISQLYEKAIEFEKLEMENDQREASRNIEMNLRLEELESDKNERKVKNIITVGSIITPLVVGSFWCYKSLIYEEKGTISSAVGRHMFDGLTKFKFWK